MDERIEQLRLAPWFNDAADMLVRPDRALPVTLYFWRRWAPRLGSNAVTLLLWIRAQLVERGVRSVEREGFEFPPQQDIARLCGLDGVKAVRSAMRRLEEAGFVTRERNRNRWDPTLGRTVRLTDRYLVSVTDPVAPEDISELVAISEARRSLAGRQATIFPPDDSTPGPGVIHSSQGLAALRAYRPQESGGPEGLQTQSGGPEGLQTQPVEGAVTCDVPGSLAALRAVTNVNENLEATLLLASVQPCARDAVARQRQLIEDLVAGLGDQRSRRFFALVASRLPEDIVRTALTDTRDARIRGGIRRNPGAYFTDLIRRQAFELGISLNPRREPCARN